MLNDNLFLLFTAIKKQQRKTRRGCHLTSTEDCASTHRAQRVIEWLSRGNKFADGYELIENRRHDCAQREREDRVRPNDDVWSKYYVAQRYFNLLSGLCLRGQVIPINSVLYDYLFKWLPRLEWFVLFISWLICAFVQLLIVSFLLQLDRLDRTGVVTFILCKTFPSQIPVWNLFCL